MPLSELSKEKAAIDRELQQILAAKVQAASKIDPVYADLLQTVAKLVERGGKRLRPLLTLLAYRGFGGDKAGILQVAASQELFHAFILMHDDVIDRDLVRWGGLNVSGHYLEMFSEQMPADQARHFSDSWALLAGDICYGLSQEVLLSSGFAPELLVEASLLTQQTLFTMIGGELLDVSLSLDKAKVATKQQLLSLAHYKTAVYSFQTPLQIGALLAGASTQQLKQIGKFAINIGIAFQLQDDLLGMFGDAKVLGKPNLSDLREGKQTLLIAKGLTLAKPPEQLIIRKLLGNPKADKTNLETMREILTTSGAKKQTQAVAEDYLAKALTVLPKIGFSEATEKQLAQLASFSIRRSK